MPERFCTRVLLFFAAFLAVVCLGESRSSVAQDFAQIKLLADHYDFAMNPETGDIAAIDEATDTVSLYQAAFFEGKQDQRKGPLKVGGKPVDVVFKKYKNRGVFIVACMRDAHLYIVDALELSLMKKVSITSDQLTSLSCSQDPADPFIYYCYGGNQNEEFGRMSLAKLADEGEMMEHTQEVVVSADGKRIYRREPSSSSSMQWLSVVENGLPDGKPRFVEHSTEHVNRVDPQKTVYGSYVADPFGEYAATGNAIFSADLTKRLGLTPGVILGFLPHKPIIICYDDGKLLLVSYNTFHRVGGKLIPESFIKQLMGGVEERQQERGTQLRRAMGIGENRQTYPRIRAFADVKNSRLVLMYHSQALAIPFTGLRIPDEPLLQATLSGSIDLDIGKQAILKLSTPTPQIKVALEAGPEGLEVTPDGIVWTPTADQAGEHTVQLNLSYAGVNRTKTIQLFVKWQSAKLPFFADGMQIGLSGKRAICWSTNDSSQRQVSGPPPVEKSSRLAVVDLEKLNVTAEVTVPYKVTAAAIDDDNVYVTGADGAPVQMLSVTDLTRKKQAAPGGDVRMLALIGDKYLYAMMQGEADTRFLLPQLTKDTIEPRLCATLNRSRTLDGGGINGQPNFGRIRDGWAMDSKVFDDKLENVTLVTSAPGIRQLAWKYPGLPSRNSLSSGYPYPQSHRTRSDEEKNLGTVALEHVPAFVSFRAVSKQQNNGPRQNEYETTLLLGVAPTERAAASERITLARFSESADNSRYTNDQTLGHIRAAGERVVAAFGEMLFVKTISDLDPALFPTAFEFEPKQSTLVIAPNETTKLSHSIYGGKAPIEFAIKHGGNELTLDADSGAVAIDGRRIVSKILAYQSNSTVASNEGWQVSFGHEDSVEKYVKEAEPNFERVVGKKPRGVPFAYPIQIQASDAEGRTAQLSYLVFVEVPKESLLKAIKSLQVQMQGPVNRAQKQKPPEEPKVKPQPVRNDANKRIEELEDRVKSLEAKIDKLTKLLEERGANP